MNGQAGQALPNPPQLPARAVDPTLAAIPPLPPQTTPSFTPKTTQEIQEMLDQNEALVKVVLECQRESRFEDANKYLGKLQSNLMYLAAIADAQQARAEPTR